MNSTVEVSPFKKWYQAHKEEFAERRMNRYHTDPEYRKQALLRAQVYRKSVRQLAPPPPAKYVYDALSLVDKLDISYNTLRSWRFKEFFPAPFKYRGLTYFTAEQAELLMQLRKFMRKHPKRRSKAANVKLADLVSVIYANWE